MTEVLDGYVIAEMCGGEATGADSLARGYADAHGIPFAPFPADWQASCPQCPGHRKRRANGEEYCPLQGYIRNQKMLDDFRPDEVVAFPGGNGTQDMCKRAAAAGVRVRAAW
jgi:hypothetical protein